MKDILFGLFPALMWGVQPLIMTKLGGRPSSKVMGMSMGILISSLIVAIFKRPSLSLRIIFFGLIDGLALGYGLINQIRGLSLLGVSKGSPISTGSQLLGASLIGAILFKEWTEARQYIIGSLALGLIIIGLFMTSFKEIKFEGTKDSTKEGVLILLLSSLGFIVYTVILRITDISIWDALIPQSLGALLASYLLNIRAGEEDLFMLESFKHILTGFFFAAGNISLMISNTINGLALGFTLTQMSVVIATLGGLIFLREDKTKKELKLTLLGLILVVIAGILIGFTKK